MGVGHEERTETQLEVTDPLALRILHIFAGHPPTGVIIGQHRGHPPELGQKLDQTGLRRADHDMRLEFLEGVPGQGDAVLPAEVEDGGQADTAIEMAVEINQGRAGRHERAMVCSPPRGDKANYRRTTSSRACSTSRKS